MIFSNSLWFYNIIQITVRHFWGPLPYYFCYYCWTATSLDNALVLLITCLRTSQRSYKNVFGKIPATLSSGVHFGPPTTQNSQRNRAHLLQIPVFDRFRQPQKPSSKMDFFVVKVWSNPFFFVLKLFDLHSDLGIEWLLLRWSYKVEIYF